MVVRRLEQSLDLVNPDGARSLSQATGEHNAIMPQAEYSKNRG